MNIPVKKLKSGFEIPRYGIGTWQMGGKWEPNPNNDDDGDVKAIQQAIDLGFKHIDTAESYASGHAEELVAKAIKNHDRSKIFLVSKLDTDDMPAGEVENHLKGSLRRLETDYLDLYLVHAPSRTVPQQKIMEEMNGLVDKGLVKNIGVSNYSWQQLEQAQKFSKHQIVVNQVHYNLMVRDPEKTGLLKYCQDNDVILEAYRPVQKGKIQPSQALQKMCEKYQKTPNQIAINWLMNQENVITIIKMKNPKHIEENVGAEGWSMDPEDVEYLRKNYEHIMPESDVYVFWQ